MNYSVEQSKQKYWQIYLDKVVEYISSFIGNPLKYKIKQKVLSFNTFLIGLSTDYDNILQPNVDLIKKYSNELFIDLQHNYESITRPIMDSIIQFMVNSRLELNILQAIEIQKIPPFIDPVTVRQNENSMELTIKHHMYSINVDDYRRLVKVYSNKEVPVNYAICILLLRYEYYGYSMQGICLSADLIYKWVNANNYDNIGLEMFAGSLNSNLPNYNSLFYDIEQYFGSKGSIFLYKNINDYKILISNPPFLTNVMSLSSKIIVNFMKYKELNKIHSISIINIPDWRSVRQYNRDDLKNDHSKNDYSKNKHLKNEHLKINEIPQVRQHGEYESYEILRSSPYFRKCILVGNFKYKNYFGQNYATIRDNILMIILSSSPDDVRIQNFIDFVINYNETVKNIGSKKYT